MSLETFSIESLATMDGGRIKVAFADALARCYADCRDRPGLREARKVTLHLSIVPAMDEERELETCVIAFHVTDSVPKRRTRKYNMIAGANGLQYNEHASESAAQRTIDELAEPKDAKLKKVT